MAGQTGRTWDPNKMYDVSPEEMRAIQERARMRKALKAEWQKKASNPYRGVGGFLFDPGVQRWQSMKATGYEQFKATPKSAGIGFMVGVFPIILLGVLIHKERSSYEKKCRTGQLSYRDRPFKFV